MKRLVLVVLPVLLLGGSSREIAPSLVGPSPIQIVAPPEHHLASTSAERGLGPYAYALTTFEMRQDCQQLIRKRWKCPRCEFQLDGLDTTTRDQSWTWWRSWVNRYGVRRSFTCVHDAKTNWMTMIFAADSEDIRPFEGLDHCGRTLPKKTRRL